jgi:septal ring factor EnvC (AmiA/AmiB activator)
VRRQPKIRIAAAVAGCTALLAGTLAIAGEPSLEQRISSARTEADQVTQRIESRSARLAALQQQAGQAAARERELTQELAEGATRTRELSEQMAVAEEQLEQVRGRYHQATEALAGRLVEIYKSGTPDYLSVVLSSEDFEDLSSRTQYLEALNDADAAQAERVKRLNDELSAKYSEVAGLKHEQDAESHRLTEAKREVAAIRAGAEQRAAAVAGARAEERAALAELQQRISGWELEVRKQAAQEIADGGGEDAFLGGPYAIPTYIVMCESGGNYRALNPSSGAGGAYQILPSTWRAYGGRGLPHQASKAEQDRIAAIIWENDGPNAWSCAQ